MYVDGGRYVYFSIDAHGVQKTTLESQAIISCPMWVLATDLGSLNH